MPFVELADDEKNQFLEPCCHLEHNPPSMVVVTRPVKWVCPGCGAKTFLRPPQSTMACAPPSASRVVPSTRTRSQVLAERAMAVTGGCCDRFADMSGCDCLETAIPDGTVGCSECGGSGWAVHPQNGWNRNARRCSRGCASRCAVCRDPNCDNPNGQH